MRPRDAVAAVLSALEALAQVDPHDASDPAAIEVAELLLTGESVYRSVVSRWLARVDSADATVAECGRSTRSWLVEEQLLNPAEATRRMRLARWLPAYRLTDEALSTGDITAEHALVVLKAMRSVPAELAETTEAALVELAKSQPPFVVARALDEVLVRVGAQSSSDEAYLRRYGERGVHLDDTFGGVGSLSGTVMPETAEKVRLALEAASASCGPDDDRTPAQRRHDGLGEIAGFYLEHAETKDSCGERPRIVVTLDLDTLLERLEDTWATLDSGVKLSPAAARRLACDAEIIPASLGSTGEVLDLGRSSRTFNAAIRRAAKLRDGSRCAFPGCRRTIVELHHIVWWSRGGRTSLDNAAWLCAFHHWLVHEGGWSMRRDADGSYTFTAADGRCRSSPPPRHAAA
jgi:hypothetical protein